MDRFLAPAPDYAFTALWLWTAGLRGAGHDARGSLARFSAGVWRSARFFVPREKAANRRLAAPYVALLPKESQLWPVLMKEGWGKKLGNLFQFRWRFARRL